MSKVTQRRRTTLRDVAKEADVAVSTVSGILTSRSDSWASEETRERVLAAAKKLGYHANQLARGLRLNRFQLVVAILPDITSPYFAALARALHRALEFKGYELLIEETEMKPAKEVRALQDLANRHIDGAICTLMDASAHRPLLKELNARFPIIVAGGMVADADIDTIDIDCHQSLGEAIDHLVDLGHKRIGFVDSHFGFCDYNQRLEIFRAAMEAKGLGFPDSWLLRCTHSLSDIRHTVRNWAIAIPPKDRPTALCCLNDLTAMGAIRGLADLGLSVPRDISVVGFDDIFLADFLVCPLTTIALPADTLAQMAAELLVNRITGKVTGAATRIDLPTRFVVRESTGRVTPEVRNPRQISSANQ